jgi:dephospho-CoA kinase
MIVTGIIGGIASGKSVVSGTLRSLGALILDADRIGHQVLLNEDIKQQVRARWGDRVFGEDGEINRSLLASLVFAPDSPNELQALEQITHPSIGAQIREQIAAARSSASYRMLVLDAPVMIKSGWYRECGILLFVDCPRWRRIEFARGRGWDEETLDRRESRQAPLELKRRMATHIITNDGTLDRLRQQVHQFWESVIDGNPPTRPVPERFSR